MGSAAEAEIGAEYMTKKDTVLIRTCLEEIGCLQNITPIKVDNTTDVRFANKTIKQKRSKAIYMRLNWL